MEVVKMVAKEERGSTILGIDIGGSGIKGAPVDIENGELVAERMRIATPRPASPAKVSKVVAELVEQFQWKGDVGCTFPGVVKEGVVYTAANVHRNWIGTDCRGLFEERTNCTMTVLNDADAAGMAEMAFGAGRGQQGLVMMVTLGTGIGTALFMDGYLVPNSELGHLIVRGEDAEKRASDRARSKHSWSWKKWAKRLDEYLDYVESLLNPDLFILGGGVSKKHERFLGHLDTRAPVVPAEMRNEAGIVGAALAAHVSDLTGTGT
jgi:polyphosphate glucokinase